MDKELPLFVGGHYRDDADTNQRDYSQYERHQETGNHPYGTGQYEDGYEYPTSDRNHANSGNN